MDSDASSEEYFQGNPAEPDQQVPRMDQQHLSVAVFESHPPAQKALYLLRTSENCLKNVSVAGKAYASDEKAAGMHNLQGRTTVWGGQGPFWSRLWADFGGGLMLSTPFMGSVAIFGNLAEILTVALHARQTIHGLTPFSSALFATGIPRSKVLAYENAVKAHGLLVLFQGTHAQTKVAQYTCVGSGAKSADIYNTGLGTIPETAAV